MDIIFITAKSKDSTYNNYLTIFADSTSLVNNAKINSQQKNLVIRYTKVLLDLEFALEALKGAA